jgi:hypothetical protein
MFPPGLEPPSDLRLLHRYSEPAGTTKQLQEPFMFCVNIGARKSASHGRPTPPLTWQQMMNVWNKLEVRVP